MGNLVERMLANIRVVNDEKIAAGKQLFIAKRIVNEKVDEVAMRLNNEYGVDSKRALFTEIMQREARMTERVNKMLNLPIGEAMSEYASQNNMSRNDIRCKCTALVGSARCGKPTLDYEFMVKTSNPNNEIGFVRRDEQVRFADDKDVSAHIVHRTYKEINGDSNSYTIIDPQNMIIKLSCHELELIRQNKPKLFKALVAVLDRQIQTTSTHE